MFLKILNINNTNFTVFNSDCTEQIILLRFVLFSFRYNAVFQSTPINFLSEYVLIID